MGMTLAHRLAQKGHTVTIFEAAPELGGLVSSWKMGDVEWDKFYHVILLSDFRTRNILKEIGLEEATEWVETKTGFYINGKLHSMSDTIEFLKFPTLNLIDKFRLGLTILVASRIKNWKRLEQIPVTTWLKKSKLRIATVLCSENSLFSTGQSRKKGRMRNHPSVIIATYFLITKTIAMQLKIYGCLKADRNPA